MAHVCENARGGTRVCVNLKNQLVLLELSGRSVLYKSMAAADCSKAMVSVYCV